MEDTSLGDDGIANCFGPFGSNPMRTRATHHSVFLVTVLPSVLFVDAVDVVVVVVDALGAVVDAVRCRTMPDDATIIVIVIVIVMVVNVAKPVVVIVPVDEFVGRTNASILRGGQ